MAENKRVFQGRRINNRAVTFILGVFCMAFLSFFLIRKVLGIIYVDPQLYPYLEILLPVLIGIGSGILFVVIDKQVTIEIDDESLTYKKGKNVEKYSLDAFAGTNVINNYMNGGYSGSDRYLKFFRADGKIRQISVPFKEQEFSDIVSLIVKKQRADNDIEEITNGIRYSFDGGRRIEIPKDEFIQTFTKSSNTKRIISIIIAVLSVGVCILTYLMFELYVFIAMAIIFGFFGLSLAAIVYFYGRKETKKALSDTPAFVLIEPFCIYFENDKYDASEISKIVASPYSYDSIRQDEVTFRTVVITDRHNNEHRYCFGRAPKDNKKMVFEGYSELVASLDSWCFANHIEFRLKLG